MCSDCDRTVTLIEATRDNRRAVVHIKLGHAGSATLVADGVDITEDALARARQEETR